MFFAVGKNQLGLATNCFFKFIFRKPIVPQKVPSPLLDKKIEELEAKFADMEDLDDDMDDLDEDDDEAAATPSMPPSQASTTSDMDMPYTPPQVPHTP